MRVINIVFVLIVLVLVLVGCGKPQADGTLEGYVVWENGGTVINPSIIIGRQHPSATTPPQSGEGDSAGKFVVNVPGGKYIIKLSSTQLEPYYTWPSVVNVEPGVVTTMEFALPEGY